MRRAVLPWLVVGALAVAIGFGVVLGLNATVFGSAGFVRVYLEAVARGDARGALSMPGVAADPDARADFLVDAALGGLDALQEVAVERRPDGTEEVTFAWRTGTTVGASTFTVERIGTRLGLFPEWGFVASPVATVDVTIAHDERFDLNGVAAETGIGAAAPVSYAVLAPGVYRLDHHSTYLEAAAVDVVVDLAPPRVSASLDVQASPALLTQITTEVHDYLRECATQEVLFPTGCPLGHAIANRVVSTPAWSIAEYPELTVGPGPEFGTWLVPSADVVSHLRVDVQSLFDGTVSTFDEDLPLTVSYVVTIQADDRTLRIVPQ